MKQVAARHGIYLTYGEITGTADHCRQLLSDAHFSEIDVITESGGSLMTRHQLETAWPDRPTHPLLSPLRNIRPSLMELMKSEYLAEVRARETDSGIWSERTTYFAIGKRTSQR